MSSDAPPAPVEQWDDVRLLAQMRLPLDDDTRQRLVEEAYRRTFHTERGRFVMLHHLQSCGVGRRFGPDGASREYATGMHDAAVMLANDAGFDEAALALTLLTNNLLEEPDHERNTDSPGAIFDGEPADGDF